MSKATSKHNLKKVLQMKKKSSLNTTTKGKHMSFQRANKGILIEVVLTKKLIDTPY
jgi:hypothetical protein